MDTKLPRRYFLVPVLYVLLIGALLAVEFTGTVRIQEQFANVSFSAVLPARQGGNGRGVHRVSLEMDGFVLSFERQNPLEFRLESGRSLYASLTRYAVLPGAIEIDFADGFQLLFHSSGGDQIRVEIISGLDEPAELVVPYTSSGAVTINEHSGLPLLNVLRKTRSATVATVIALPPESTIDLVNGAFIFRNGKGSFSDFFINRFESSASVLAGHWFQMQYTFPGAKTFDADLEAYLAEVYRGWTSTRFSRSNGTWRMPDGTREFDESIVSGVLTEAARRDTSASVLTLLRNATILYQDRITYRSSPYLGDVVVRGRRIEESDLELIRTVRSMVSNGDLAVFAIPGLLSFARDRAPTPLFQELADFAARVDTEAAGIPQVLGLLEAYLASTTIDDPQSEAYARFRPLVEDILLAALTLTDRGLLVGSQLGRAELASTIKAGSLLLTLSELEEDSLLGLIGKELIATAISFSLGDGFLPAVVEIDDRRVVATSGFVRPEAVYTALAGNRYYPRHVSLGDTLSPGAWAWTAAENFSVGTRGTATVLSFEYPEGGIHHFVVHGVEAFSQISLFGIQWKSDPRFQFYGTGWLYDEAAKVLYVKISHVSRREELVITY